MSTATAGGWAALVPGASLPEVVLHVTETTVILVPVATWDLFPGHHSPSYARAQGQKDMYLNTIALQGVVDRTVTDTLGPTAWVTRRKLQMRGSVYPGDTLRGSARVIEVRGAQNGSPEAPTTEADLVVEMTTDGGPALMAEVTVRRYHHEGAS